MEVLRNLFGNATAGIIRLLVTVGILAAVYFFIVKPVLHTTETVSHETNINIQKSIGGSGLNDIGKTIEDVNRKVQREIKRSFEQSQQHGHANKLVHCIQHAHGDVHRIERCTARY
jgi:purine nucleoside phosphorylase